MSARKLDLKCFDELWRRSLLISSTFRRELKAKHVLFSYNDIRLDNSGNWVVPGYFPNHLGGSVADWPPDGRKYLSFWGDSGGIASLFYTCSLLVVVGDVDLGGCCYEEYAGARAWNLAFRAIYVNAEILQPAVDTMVSYPSKTADCVTEGVLLSDFG